MMPNPRVPAVYANGCWHASGEIDAAARYWRAHLAERIEGSAPWIAMALPATPEGVAALAAATGLPVPVVVVGPDEASWFRIVLPAGSPIVLPPSLAALAAPARARGWLPHVLPARPPHDEAPAFPLLTSSGIVLFSSGSTGAPKPVFRPMRALVDSCEVRAAALGLGRGAGILLGVSIVHGQGLNMVLTSMLLGGPLGLLPAVNHRAALAAMAMPEFHCWRATPHFADALGRCTLIGPPKAPPVCVISSPISRDVFGRFRDRFGVPLRQAYSSVETGPISIDRRPDDLVQPGTVGSVLPGIELHMGDRPGQPDAAGRAGRLWVRSPWAMAGYGLPPALERPGVVDGFWPTRDLARLRDDGQIVLEGRVDDCIRTRENRLVNLAAVADLVRDIDGVRDAAVVALAGSAGSSFGALVEWTDGRPPDVLHAAIATLPAWARPRTVGVVAVIPRLPTGKPDRAACVAVLRGRHP